MNSLDDLPIIAEAEWPQEGRVPIRLRVHASPMYYGTGDFEDPADLAEERPANFYILSRDTAEQPGVFSVAEPDLESVGEVIATVERLFPGARWLKRPEVR